MTTTWSISDSYYTPIDEGFYQEVLEPGVYSLLYNQQGPLLKKESEKFNLPSKVYGINQTFINRVVKTFNQKDSNNLGVLLYGIRGAGKEQPVSEPVLTPNGWKVMGDLQVNEYVIGSDGLPTKILEIHPQGVKDVYTLKTLDGVEIKCGADHLWFVNYTSHGQVKRKAFTTLQLIDKGLKTSHSYKFRIESFAGLQEGLTIDYAYALGYCLGNGCFTREQLFVSYDSRIENEVISKLRPSLGVPANSRTSDKHSGQSAYSWANIHPEIAKYRDSGKSGNKHLLKEHNWLSWNYNSRLELLKGLLDSDGSITKTGQRQRLKFSSTSIDLITLTKDLIRSLGGVCNEPIIDSRTHYKSGNCWELNFRTPLCPFKLTSKTNKWRLSNTKLHVPIVSITKETYQEESKCITVEAADHLYITTGFKLTHNSCTAQIICNVLQLPVIVVKSDNKLSTFINSIKQDVIVLIDEFEKIYGKRNEDSADLLSLLDGLNTVNYKRLFILTCNDLFINQNLLDRPGRIRYKKQYGNLSQLDIKEIVLDKLNWYGETLYSKVQVVEDLVETCNSLNIITIDAVISLIEEVNLHEYLASDLIEDFNLTKNVSSFKVSRQLILKNSSGETYFSPIQVISLNTRNVNQKSFGGNKHCSFYVDSIYHGSIEEIIDENKAIVELSLSYNDALADEYLSKYLQELSIKEVKSSLNDDDNDSEIFTVNSIYTLEPIQSRNYFSYM